MSGSEMCCIILPKSNLYSNVSHVNKVYERILNEMTFYMTRRTVEICTNITVLYNMIKLVLTNVDKCRKQKDINQVPIFKIRCVHDWCSIVPTRKTKKIKHFYTSYSLFSSRHENLKMCVQR